MRDFIKLNYGYYGDRKIELKYRKERFEYRKNAYLYFLMFMCIFEMSGYKEIIGVSLSILSEMIFLILLAINLYN